MSLLPADDIKIYIGNLQWWNITPRIINMSKIHLYLDDENSAFRISTFDVEIDNSDNILAWYKTYVKGPSPNIPIQILNSQSEILWFGTGYGNVFNSPDNTLKFEFEHEFAKFKNNGYGPISAPYNEHILVDNFIENSFDQLGSYLYTVNIDMSGVTAYSQGPWTWDQYWVYLAYFKLGAMDYLAFMGDFLRSFGAVILPRKDQPYESNDRCWIVDRDTLLAQSAVDVSEYLLDNIKDIKWDHAKKFILINSTARDEDGDPVDGHVYQIGTNTGLSQTNSLLEIEANLIANLLIRLSNNSYHFVYDFMNDWIYDRYVTWFVRDTDAVEYMLSGVEWYPGEMHNFNDNYNVMVEEVIWDLENRKSTIKGFKIPV